MTTTAPSQAPASDPGAAGSFFDRVPGNSPGFVDAYNHWLGSTLSDTGSGLLGLASLAGIVLLVWKILASASAARKSGNSFRKEIGGHLSLIIFACILIAPAMVLPLIIGIADMVAALFVTIGQTVLNEASS